MCFSPVIDQDKCQVSDPSFKREYKDDEKKVIKNKKYYCKLILFYISKNNQILILNFSKYLIINELQIILTANHHIYEIITILNNSK